MDLDLHSSDPAGKNKIKRSQKKCMEIVNNCIFKEVFKINLVKNEIVGADRCQSQQTLFKRYCFKFKFTPQEQLDPDPQ